MKIAASPSRRKLITGRGRTRKVSAQPPIIFITFFTDNVYRARAAHREALQALRDNDLDEATDAADKMMYLLALQKIHQPLVELDMAGHLIATSIKVIIL